MTQPNDQKSNLVPQWTLAPIVQPKAGHVDWFYPPALTVYTDSTALVGSLANEIVAAIEHGQKRFADLPPVWFTVEQAAAYLNLSPDTIERLAASGKLKSAEIHTGRGKGKRAIRRFKRKWLNDFMLASCPPPPPPPPATPRKRQVKSFGDHIK